MNEQVEDGHRLESLRKSRLQREILVAGNEVSPPRILITEKSCVNFLARVLRNLDLSRRGSFSLLPLNHPPCLQSTIPRFHHFQMRGEHSLAGRIY
jgi:predicted transcriptional regulator with HTH domain